MLKLMKKDFIYIKVLIFKFKKKYCIYTKIQKEFEIGKYR